MGLKELGAKIVGNILGRKLNLQEGNMSDTKKWYMSKNVWTGVVTFLFGAYSLFQTTVGPSVGVTLPTIPEWVFAFLGALGIYTRVIADKKIN